MLTSISPDGSAVVSDSVRGPRLFHLDPFGPVKTPWPDTRVSCVRLLQPSLVTLTAMVSARDPRTVTVHVNNLWIPVFESTLPAKVLDVCMNRACLVVLTADGTITVYSMPTGSWLRRMRLGRDMSACRNYCALSENNWLVILAAALGTDSDVPRAAEAGVGAVLVYDIESGRTVAVFGAHQQQVVAVAVSGTLVATALATGTIVRLFSIDGVSGTARCLEKWRRGRNPATVTRLLFSHDGGVVACASTHTIHLFRVSEGEGIVRKCDGVEGDGVEDDVKEGEVKEGERVKEGKVKEGVEKRERWKFQPRVPHYAKSIANVQPRSFAHARVSEKMDQDVLIAVARNMVWLVVHPTVYTFKVTPAHSGCELVSLLKLQC